MRKNAVICAIIILVGLSFAVDNAVTDFCEKPSSIIIPEVPPTDLNIQYNIEWSISITSSVLALGITPVCIGTYPAGETLLWISHGGTSSTVTTDNWILIYNLNTRTLVDSFPQPTNSGWGYRDMCFYNGYVYAGYEGYLHKIDPVTHTVVGTYTVSTPTVVRALADNNVEDSLWTSNFTVPIYKISTQGGTARQVAPAVFAIYGLSYDPQGYMWGYAQNPMSTLIKYAYPSFASYDSCQITEIINPIGDSAIAGGCEMWRDSFLLILGQAKPLDKVYCLRVVFRPPSLRDVGVNAIRSPGANHIPNTPMVPIARVKNFGAATQTNFPVVCSIVGAGGVVRYTNTQTVASLATGDTILVNFASWTPTIEEMCTVKMKTSLTNDSNPANDGMMSTTNITSSINIIIGTGTSGSSLYLMYGYNAYSASEAIYLQSEIGYYGPITHVAYYKTTGTSTVGFDDVRIYMRHTSATSTSTGAYDTTGYTLVYSGRFPFDAVGWMNVALTNPFTYNNADNLQILVLKGPPAITSGYPSWQYTSTSPVYRNRYGYSNTGWPTSLTQSYNRPNVRLALTPSTPPANDVGITAIRSPSTYHTVNTPMTVVAVLKNYGSANQTNVPVICSIVGAGGQLRHFNTQIQSINAGDTVRVTFSPYASNISEIVTVIVRSMLTNDTNPVNDRLTQTTEIGFAYLYESFTDATFPPNGWTVYNFGVTPGDAWARQTSYYYSAPACAYIYYDLPNNDWLITPRIRRTGASDSLTFWWRAHTASTTYNETLLVRVSVGADVSDTVRYTVIGELTTTNNITWWRAAFNLSPYGESLYIAFHYKNYNDWGVAIDDVRVLGEVSIEEEKPNKLPIATTLNAPKPNPALNGLAQISFTLAEPNKVNLSIYDASGRLIKTLINSHLDQGVYNYNWNGTDDNNHEVAEGVYFYTLKTENYSSTKKLILTR